MSNLKVLVFSNNIFSLSDSNGRTLGNFFKGWPKKHIAQFCINANDPNFEICDNYYYVSDYQALISFLGFKKNITGKLNKNVREQTTNRRNRFQKTVFKSIIRNIIWNSYRWKNDTFKAWHESFNPDIILLQNGDSYFMLKIATDLAKEKDIPLVIYNSEGYYFKNYNFMKNTFAAKFWYKLYIYLYRKQFDKTINHAKFSIYSNDMLKTDYDKIFNKPSSVIYTSSNIIFKRKKWNNDVPIFSYVGNLNLGRHYGLIEIARALQKIDSNFTLNVYGKALSEDVINSFKDCAGINYKGFVSYSEVIDIIYTSDVLVHVEKFSQYSELDLKYSFSTKIADILSSGTNFFIYAPDSLAGIQYLMKNECAWVATDSKTLEYLIYRMMNDSNQREYILNNAQKVARNFHDINVNSKIFKKILENAAIK